MMGTASISWPDDEVGPQQQARGEANTTTMKNRLPSVSVEVEGTSYRTAVRVVMDNHEERGKMAARGIRKARASEDCAATVKAARIAGVEVALIDVTGCSSGDHDQLPLDETDSTTVTTAPITTDLSSSWSIHSNHSAPQPLPTTAPDVKDCQQQQQQQHQMYATPASPEGFSVSSAAGPFIHQWPGVENLVDELCSPIYCVRKSVQYRSTCWWGGPQLTMSNFEDGDGSGDDLLNRKVAEEEIALQSSTICTEGQDNRAEQILKEHFLGGELLASDSLDNDDDKNGHEEPTTEMGSSFSPFSTRTMCDVAIQASEDSFPDDEIVDEQDRPFLGAAVALEGREDSEESREEEDRKDLQLQPCHHGHAVDATTATNGRDQYPRGFMPVPRPQLSKLFGEMLCRVYLRNVAHLVSDGSIASSCGSLRSAALSSLGEAPSRGQAVVSPISVHSSFIFFPREQSFLVAHNWASSQKRLLVAPCSSSSSSPSSSPKSDVAASAECHEDSERQWTENVPQSPDNKISAVVDTAATLDDKNFVDDLSASSSGFWDISESGVMTPATGVSNKSSNSNATTTIFVDPASARIVEEGAALFEDEDLRAFMLMTKGGDDASAIFPSFSQDSCSYSLGGSDDGLSGEMVALTKGGDDPLAIFPTFSRDSYSLGDSDDGLSREIVALGSAEYDLRRELETADQVIKGVLARQHDEISQKFSKASMLSPFTTTESMQLLSPAVNEEEGEEEHEFSICKLPSTDGLSTQLSIDTSSGTSHPTPSSFKDKSLSLRKVRFSKNNEEFIFFSDRSANEETEESFHDFLFGTFEEIHASLGDFLDEIGCRPISFSTRRPSPTKSAKISTVYYY